MLYSAAEKNLIPGKSHLPIKIQKKMVYLHVLRRQIESTLSTLN